MYKMFKTKFKVKCHLLLIFNIEIDEYFSRTKSMALMLVKTCILFCLYFIEMNVVSLTFHKLSLRFILTLIKLSEVSILHCRLSLC